MKEYTHKKIKREIYWLLVITILAALIEYAVIKFLNLHPVVSLRLQGFIGLVLIGYGIRMVARLWASESEKNNSEHNGQLE